MKPIYILYSKPFYRDSIDYCDFIYIDEDNSNSQQNQQSLTQQSQITSNLTNNLKLLRITNIKPEFMILRLPGSTIQECQRKITSILATQIKNNNIELSVVQMRDSQFYTPQLQQYIKLVCNNHVIASDAFFKLKNYIARYMSSIDVELLNPVDKLIYNQSENPFRHISCATSYSKLNTFLCTKFNVPNVGSVNINTECMEFKPFSSTLSTTLQGYELNYSKIQYAFEASNDGNNYINSLRIMSYDIEVYKPDSSPEYNPTDPTHEIISIGFSFYYVNNPKPIYVANITSKDIDLNQQFQGKSIKDKLVEFNEYELSVAKHKSQSTLQYKKYTITDDDTNENFMYYTTKSEKDLLAVFITLIKQHHPYVIIGFNNWGFDDKWIHTKLEYYKLEDLLINALWLHVPIETKDKKQQNIVSPKYENLLLKWDGAMRKDKQSYKNGFTTFYDIMHMQIKEDAKRFNTGESKSLVSMLKIYDIKSPFSKFTEPCLSTNSNVLTKTGLTYSEMNKCWEDNTRIFDIAYYCLNDAMITGILAIQRNSVTDKIEMSNITSTTFQDSVFRADNIRTGNTIIKYSYLENFALFDVVDSNSRFYNLISVYGNKSYDKRTIIGGAVKNYVNGNVKDIVAVDFSSMYPSQKEGSNIDTSSKVDKIILEHPEYFGLTLKNKYHMEDMYGDRWFYEFNVKSDSSINNPDSNNTTITIEENFVEFKVNFDRLKQIQQLIDKTQTLPDSIKSIKLECLYDLVKKEIYPLGDNKTKDELYNLLINPEESIPHIIKYPLYFVQSPKDEVTNLPIVHYSLKEKMLSDFRAKRKYVKSIKPINKTHKSQLDAKEKAIKVVMNSEYGQTANEAFSWYDPQIASAVTYSSRRCIAECTSCLNSHHFYVDETYVNDNNLKYLIQYATTLNHSDDVKIEYIKYNPLEISLKEGIDVFDIVLEGTQMSKDDIQNIKNNTDLNTLTFNSPKFQLIDYRLPPRRLTLCKVYNKLKQELIESNYTKDIYVYRITLPKSNLVYQDTDSNYYTNHQFVSYHSRRTPETIISIMDCLINHNKLISKLISNIINRKPIGTDFEGAFIVARYLNKKKKYYGKKWNPNIRSWIEIPRTKNYSLNEYESNHIVIPSKDYNSTPNDHGVLVKLSKSDDINSNEITITNLPDTFYIRYDYKHLPEDYEQYLKGLSGDKDYNFLGYYSTIPFKNGSYIYTNLDVCLKYNLLDYVMKFGVKCTGVDLARRDQFKFINFNHLLVFSNDLRYTFNSKFDVPNIQVNVELEQPIRQLLLNYAGKYIKCNKSKFQLESQLTQQNLTQYEKNYYQQHKDFIDNSVGMFNVFYPWSEVSTLVSSKVKNNETDVFRYLDYPLEYYTKIIKYNNKDNGCVQIVDRLIEWINDPMLNYTIITNYINSLKLNYMFNSYDPIEVLDDFESFVKTKLDNTQSILTKLNDIRHKIESNYYLNQLKSIKPNLYDSVEFIIINPNTAKFKTNTPINGVNYTYLKDQAYLLAQLRVIYTDDEIREMLDYRYYFTNLTTSLFNYVVVEKNHELNKLLALENDLNDNDKKKNKKLMDNIISHSIQQLQRPVIEEYYPKPNSTKPILKNLNIKFQLESQSKSTVKPTTQIKPDSETLDLTDKPGSLNLTILFNQCSTILHKDIRVVDNQMLRNRYSSKLLNDYSNCQLMLKREINTIASDYSLESNIKLNQIITLQSLIEGIQVVIDELYKSLHYSTPQLLPNNSNYLIYLYQSHRCKCYNKYKLVLNTKPKLKSELFTTSLRCYTISESVLSCFMVESQDNYLNGLMIMLYKYFNNSSCEIDIKNNTIKTTDDVIINEIQEFMSLMCN